ncbi:MAG: isoleucine--tRNA ligase [Ignavibacteriota bacterium]
MYPELKTSLSPDEREHEILRRWKEKNIFHRSVGERSAENIFSFYEGPPTVNGDPGIHHVISRTIKDTICRYKTMQGFRVERKAGWDTHGLPVEIAIEKKLGFKHKQDILEYGVAEFNQKCKESVYENIERKDGWEAMTERMAYWVDMSKPYITCTPDYVESVWWALKKFYDAGKIYRGHKIQPYCPRCETALSSHEVALGYKTAKDPSVFVKFKRKGSKENESFLAWTTTPWTLISNIALAVHPDVDYVTVLNTRKDKPAERLILAEPLLQKLDGEYEILSRAKGKDFEGEEYEPLFDYLTTSDELLRLPEYTEKIAKSYRIVSDTYVTTEDGTGIVHQSPAYGEDDYRVSLKYGFPLVVTVDESGNFKPYITRYAGKFFKDADPEIVDDLKKAGLLYRKETIEHTYPFCWRCDTPLLYYARNSWYIRVTDYRDELVKQNKTINWHPPEIGEGRFGNWLSELKDWGISRERFWGTPFPIWISADGEETKGIGSYKELIGAEWLDDNGNPTGNFFSAKDAADFDPHKPLVDKLAFKSDKGKGYLKRVPDVIDVWFDSGSMPFAQYHYPFENKEIFDKAFPADFISEGIDQTRGWFYTLHAVNTFLFGKPAFKNIIVNDLVLDKQGQKMSKSKGNTINAFEAMKKFGVDAIRWNFMETSVPWKPKLYNEADLVDVERKFFGTLINTYGFFILYANIDGFTYENVDHSNPGDRPETDRWILSKLNSLIKECTANFNDYDITRACRSIQEFVIEELSNWYVRRSRRRFWKGEMNADKQAAYETLYECLLTISKLMAPVAPFLADKLFQSLDRNSDSVHLELYPVFEESVIDSALEIRMHKAQVVSSLVRQMRERAKIKVRQPLERLLIPSANRKDIEELRKVEEIILDEVNVKRVEHIEFGDSDVIKRRAKANFKLLGAKLGKQMKHASSRIATMNDDEIRLFEQQGYIEFPIEGENIRIDRGEIEIVAEDVEGWLVSSEAGVTVALDTAISPALLGEGIAREFVNRIQNLRKDLGFDVTDRIKIEVSESTPLLERILDSHSHYIKEETLAVGIDRKHGAGSETASEIEIGEDRAVIRLFREDSR